MLDTFHDWWRTRAQFFPPIDKLTSDEAKESYRQFAQYVYTDVSTAWDAGYKAGFDEGEEHGKGTKRA